MKKNIGKIKSMSKFSLIMGLLLIFACDHPVGIHIPKILKTEVGPCFRVKKSTCIGDRYKQCRVDLEPTDGMLPNEQFPDNPILEDELRRVTLNFLVIRGDIVCKERDIYTDNKVFYRWELLFDEQPL